MKKMDIAPSHLRQRMFPVKLVGWQSGFGALNAIQVPAKSRCQYQFMFYQGYARIRCTTTEKSCVKFVKRASD